jgi:hypothetical protein
MNVIVIWGFFVVNFIIDTVNVRKTNPSIWSCKSQDMRRLAIERVVIMDASNDFALFHCK